MKSLLFLVSTTIWEKYHREEPQNLFLKSYSRNKIQFEFSPNLIGEYIVSLYHEGRNRTDKPLLMKSFFVVPDHLLKLKPFKGDLHLHTHYSDGEESPVYMAAKAREIGLDYAAITDHRYYESSLEAIREADRHQFDILLFPGEEINYQLGLGHILSINAEESIDRKLRPRGEKDSMQSIVNGLYAEFSPEIEKRKLLDGVDPKLYAYSYGIVKKIREAGGLAIIAHPYWVTENVFDLVSSTYDQILRDRHFDALEIFGESTLEEHMLSLSRFQTELPRDPVIAFVSNSDAHRSVNHNPGKNWSVTFAEQLDKTSILKAIRNKLTTACISTGKNETIVVGPFLLTEYTYFLFREFFPYHDEICRILGGLYQSMLREEKGDLRKQKELQESLNQLYKKYFG